MTNPERTNESIAQYITKVGIFPNGSVEHLSWQKEEIIKALGAKDALYNKACGGRAYLDEQVMKLQHEKAELQAKLDDLIDFGLGLENRLMLLFGDGKRLSVTERWSQIESLTKENSSLREKVEYWKERHFNDCMSAKLSGYNEGLSTKSKQLKGLREALEKVINLNPLEVNSYEWEDGNLEDLASDIGFAYNKIAKEALKQFEDVKPNGEDVCN